MLLKNTTAIITGASRGIGKAIAHLFAKNGANIAMVYASDSNAANETQASLLKEDVQVKAYKCDVSDFKATEKLVKNVLEDFGQVDILVNNAGIVRDNLILKMSEADFTSVISTNLTGAFNMTKHLYKPFMKQRSGRIINMSSIVGLMGNAGQANYAAAKAGLIGLTKSTAKELAARSVTCNAIAPGFIDSDMTRDLPEKARNGILDVIPAKRMGTDEEVAQLALFLAGPYAGYITGEVIRIDGGLYI